MRGEISVVILAGLVMSAGGAAADEQMRDMKDMEKPGASAPAVHKATGVVKNVNADTGQVTLEHGPVKSLNWPSMTMAFGVKDRSLLSKLPVGKKVEFEFVQERSKYVVTNVK
jgi:Cu(I)/Ag(I) efflux system periplasmic protein CusF